jgi:hypothetical protein
MKTVYDAYPELWRGFDRPELKALLSSVSCVKYPSEAADLLGVKTVAKTVVVMHDATLKQAAEVIGLGFEHCVQSNRPDFAQELLAAALMAARFEAFVHNPIPFFFTGFRDPKQAGDVETNLTLPFKGSTEKTELLEKLTTFLHQQPKLQAVSDLCIQAADEMLSNAMYSAPVDQNGTRLFQDFDRTTPVSYPPAKHGTLFASFSDYRVVVGVEDPFGSLNKAQFWQHLSSILEPGALAAKRTAGGAGLGIRFMIDNAANFYVYSDKKKRTVFACGFLLKGVKANLTFNKHLHCSFR